MYCWLLLQIYLLLMTAFVLQGHKSFINRPNTIKLLTTLHIN